MGCSEMYDILLAHIHKKGYHWIDPMPAYKFSEELTRNPEYLSPSNLTEMYTYLSRDDVKQGLIYQCEQEQGE